MVTSRILSVAFTSSIIISSFISGAWAQSLTGSPIAESGIATNAEVDEFLNAEAEVQALYGPTLGGMFQTGGSCGAPVYTNDCRRCASKEACVDCCNTNWPTSGGTSKKNAGCKKGCNLLIADNAEVTVSSQSY